MLLREAVEAPAPQVHRHRAMRRTQGLEAGLPGAAIVDLLPPLLIDDRRKRDTARLRLQDDPWWRRRRRRRRGLRWRRWGATARSKQDVAERGGAWPPREQLLDDDGGVESVQRCTLDLPVVWNGLV